jgi:hypothetical protein
MTGIAHRIRNIIRANMNASKPAFVDSQRALFQRKYEELSRSRDAQGKITLTAWKKHSAWKQLVAAKERELSRYSDKALSPASREAMEQLIAQGKIAIDLSDKEHLMQQDTLEKIHEQLSKIENVLLRLKNLEYAASIQKSIKEKSASLNGPKAPIEAMGFNWEELNRDLRREEYVTQALIELGGK